MIHRLLRLFPGVMVQQGRKVSRHWHLGPHLLLTPYERTSLIDPLGPRRGGVYSPVSAG